MSMFESKKDAKRGFVPSDEKNFSPSALETFSIALNTDSDFSLVHFDQKGLSSTSYARRFSLSLHHYPHHIISYQRVFFALLITS